MMGISTKSVTEYKAQEVINQDLAPKIMPGERLSNFRLAPSTRQEISRLIMSMPALLFSRRGPNTNMYC